MKTIPFASLLGAILVVAPAPAAERDLFQFRTGPGDVKVSITADATIVAADPSGTGGLHIRTQPSQSWPGVTLPAPGGVWDLSACAEISARLSNPGTNPVVVYCRVDNAGADGTRNCVTRSLHLGVGQTDTLRVPLARTQDDTLGGKLFGMRGYPVLSGGDSTVNPAQIVQLLFFVSKPSGAHDFALHEIRATGRYSPPTAWTSDATPFFPFIDAFGQYRHKTWPGKINAAADLAARREQEAQSLAADTGPANWDQYGGWATGPRLESTGFFRTQKVNGKWWLVDPEGRLFFSHGIDCVMMLDTTPVEEREAWFENFPGNDDNFKRFTAPGYALKGHYAGKRPRCFTFAGANLARKYGADWRKDYPPVIHRRLRSWGLNTIANWSDETVWLHRKTPYTDTIGSGRTRNIEGTEGYWGKFPDVFDESFERSLRAGMEGKRGKSAGDPWCIGYFSDNEMSWGDELSIGIGALKSPADQPAKLALLADLKAKHGEIAALNRAWGTSHSSWDALRDAREAPEPLRARPDLEAFYTRAADRYFSTVRNAIKSVAPGQLYLGCRFAWVNQRAAAAAARHCDVVSYNLYSRSVAGFQFNGGADVPLIIGEFHFGALDRGLFHTGLVPVPDQRTRAQAYLDYVRGALKHPQFVGTHWFQYQDEPTTGRVYDEENYQIGFVDIADTPYPEMVEASRTIAREMYR